MKAAAALRHAAFILLATQAALRALVAITGNPFFAVDPRLLAIPLEGLGPAGSVALDAMALLGCAAALAAERLDRRALDLRVIALFLAPVPVLAWHAWDDAEQMRAGSQWLATMATAVGSLHLAREVRWRLMLLGAVAALTIPLAVKGLYQVTIEYGETLRSFQENREALLAAQGWEDGSSQAEIYFRRLSQREATGWFALSNVYGSILAMLATFWVGASLAVARSRLQSGWLGIAIIFAAAALAGLTASFSKGAGAAAVIGLVLAAMCILPRRWKQRVRPLTAKVTLALLALALIVTALRGSLFPESLQGADGYSLLFRWHYWIGAARMLAAQPFTGVGPAGFQNAYLLHRPTLSPEEVTSAHSVFIDWLAGGGFLMIAWIALALNLLRRSAPAGARRGGVETSRAEESALHGAGEAGAAPRAPESRLAWRCGVLLALFAGGGAWALNRHAMFIDYHVLLMPLSLAAMTATIPLVEHLVRHLSLGMVRWAVWAALTAVFLHSQVEMTLSQPGSAAVVMLLLGAASARVETPVASQPTRLQTGGLIALAAVVLLAALHIALAAAPIIGTQRHLRRAHGALAQVGEVRQSLDHARRATNLEEHLELLRKTESTFRLHGQSLNLDATWTEIQSARRLNDAARVQRLVALAGESLDEALRRLDVDAVAAALVELESARRRRPLDRLAWRKASELWMLLAHVHATRDDVAMRDEAAETACRLAEELANRRPDSSFAVAAAARRWVERHRLAPDADALEQAIHWQQRLVTLDPNGLDAHRALADLLDQAGRVSDAIAAYERTLTINANMRLDPLKQLSEAQVRAIERRLEALRGG